VWTFWNTGTHANNLTASVSDGNLNNWFSAVGPTIQSASNTVAQIFYARKIVGSGSDLVTVTYSGSANISGCVIVEYQGADPNYPLDSVSAGYSYSTSGLLDSGNVAPANSNLLVFAGGITDSGTAGVGSGFTSVVSHVAGSSGSAITEQNTTPISGNSVLQRATACIGTCPGTSSGNWLIQMAVFRDASWTVTGGSNPARPAQIQFADLFPGTDACVRAQTAANTTINNVLTMVVDSRGEITNGIPCATPPQFGVPGMSSAGGEWLLPMGQIQVNTPLFVFGKTTYQGGCISYDSAHCSGFVSNWSSGAGGLAGISAGAWASGTAYFQGVTATCGASNCTSGFTSGTYYSVENNNTGNAPGATGWQAYWTNASFFPSPVAMVNGPVLNGTPANADTESFSLRDLSLNCAYTAGATNTATLGCAGFISSFGQEQGRLGPNVKIQNPTVVGLWLTGPLTEDTGPNEGGTVGYGSTSATANAACRTSGSTADTSLDTATISSTTVTTAGTGGNTLLNFVLATAPTSGPWVGEVLSVSNGGAGLANIAAGLVDETAHTHSFWMVWSVTDSKHFAVQAPSGQAPCSGGSCGTANFYPLGIDVSYDGTVNRINQNRGMQNWTLNASTCNTAHTNFSYFPPMAAQFSMQDTPFHDFHIEGHRVGVDIGSFGPSVGQHIWNGLITTNLYTAILIDNKFSVTGTDIKDVSCLASGVLAIDIPSYCIVDLINGNKITEANNSYVKHYWLDANSVAHLEGGNCSDMTNGYCQDLNGLAYYSNNVVQWQLNPNGALKLGVSSTTVFGSGIINLDMTKGNVLQLACGGAGGLAIALNPQNFLAGIDMTFIFVQIASGTACTVSYPTFMHGADTVSPTLGSVSVQKFIVSKNGTDLYAEAPAKDCTASCGTP
jgi:hypothetical protein